MVVAFSRTTLFCRDIEQSLVFYHDTLELQVIDDKTLKGPAAGALLGLDSCSLRIVLLADSAATPPTIGLFQISDADVSILPRPSETIALGQTATVFSTNQFDLVIQRLRKTGTRFLTEPLEYPKKQESPGSPAGLYKEAICFDPDGNLVSILQILPLENH